MGDVCGEAVFSVMKGRAGWLAWCVVGLLCAGCANTPAAPQTGAEATAFLSTRVAQILTASAATLLAAPSATATATQTPLPPSATPLPPTDTATASVTPTATDTPTITPTPRPTELLSTFLRPPAAMTGEPHFFFGSPFQNDHPAYIASAYRYGSLGKEQRFAPHHGVDFAGEAGTPLVAVAPGVIYYAGSDAEKEFGPRPNFYGNLVVMQLAAPWAGHTVYALYGHLDAVTVSAGQTVNAGDVLGTVGATGVALGPHPHLEVRLDYPESYWDTRNPELWLTPGLGQGALAVRITNANNQYLPAVRVSLLCADAAPRFLETYWYSGVNPDDTYGENAALTNIPAGNCEITADVLGQTLRATAFVPNGGLALVWLKTSNQ